MHSSIEILEKENWQYKFTLPLDHMAVTQEHWFLEFSLNNAINLVCKEPI